MQLKEHIDDIVLFFERSNYPNKSFTHSDNIIDVHIRIPHSFPIIETPTEGEYNSKTPNRENCLAIEYVEIHKYTHRNKGLFSYLVSRLLQVDNIHYVVVQNISSKDLAYRLYKSEHWSPMPHPGCLQYWNLMQLVPLLRTEPKSKDIIYQLIKRYTPTGSTLFEDAIVNLDKLIRRECYGWMSDEELIGIKKESPPHGYSSSIPREHEKFIYDVLNIQIAMGHIKEDRECAHAFGESLAKYYGKTVIDRYYTSRTLRCTRH